MSEEKIVDHIPAKILDVRLIAYKGNKSYAVKLEIEEVVMTRFFAPIVMRQIRDSFNVDQIRDCVGKFLMIPKMKEKTV